MHRLSVAALAVALLPAAARAELNLTMIQQGNDVVVSGSGSLKVTNAGLGDPSPGSTPSVSGGVRPSTGYLSVGTSSATPTNAFFRLSGPVFGPGAIFLSPTSGTGGRVAVDSGGGGYLYVPAGYVSGGPLTASSTYANQTFSSLGVTPGFYEWTWGGGPAEGGIG